ncbi:RNA-guided endonuclease IscB [Chroococcidiopsis thermalis]|uniref:HNH endonuclease n=1 Tax=Chroococcidiopsis thermalis (strain PCC 7203) TaxID=251229 RepID=K9U9P1_CHRTP|nr:RNA-guided endonuclease IscB [Chroococcidiopsis thermalis]AFY91156.1 HNH endonuclease [Chroococcidiopsis thermalis PCC 7203]
MQNYVFVIDQNKQPLNLIPPARARELLTKQKAAVFRMYPFTIILKHAVANPLPKPLTIKIDPGSKVTGIAIFDGENVIWVAELEHRGGQIKNALLSRRSLRRSRRNRKTRYRPARFDNRKRKEGWLPPSLMHRVLTVETWVKRLCRYAPITQVVMELVRFDTQKMQNPEIDGVEYQQGELAGYEVREYLLEKWGHNCVYCDKQDVPLQIEHIYPRAKGGSNRVSNLTLSCEKCNSLKGILLIDEFLKKDLTRLERIKRQSKTPLKDAAAVNSTRWKLYNTLKEMLPITTGTGGQTKFNRIRFGLKKQHWIDAVCVGNIEAIKLLTQQPLRIKCTGWGTRKMCSTDEYGFPIRHRDSNQVHFGFRTGNIVKAIVTSGKKVGEYVGRVLCRKTGSFDIATKTGRVTGISHRFCTSIHKKDGYSYVF